MENCFLDTVTHIISNNVSVTGCYLKEPLRELFTLNTHE